MSRALSTCTAWWAPPVTGSPHARQLMAPSAFQSGAGTWSESRSHAAVVREAFGLAEEVRRGATEHGMTIYAEMASMLQGYLPRDILVAVS